METRCPSTPKGPPSYLWIADPPGCRSWIPCRTRTTSRGQQSSHERGSYALAAQHRGGALNARRQRCRVVNKMDPQAPLRYEVEPIMQNQSRTDRLNLVDIVGIVRRRGPRPDLADLVGELHVPANRAYVVRREQATPTPAPSPSPSEYDTKTGSLSRFRGISRGLKFCMRSIQKWMAYTSWGFKPSL